MGKGLSKILVARYYRAAEEVVALETTLPSKKIAKEKLKIQRARLAFKVLSRRVRQNIFEFLIIILLDPSESFNALKKRDEFSVCATSYVEYRLYSKKLRLLSLGGISAIVMTSLIVSLLTSYIFPYFRVSAATVSWVQTSWSGGATTTTANNDSNQTNWTYFSAKTTSTIISSGKVTTAGFVVGSDDTSSDFASGTQSFTEIVGTATSGSVQLVVPQ